MADREKVIKGLKIHSKSMHLNNCNECPYDNCEEEDENGDYEGECTFCLTNDVLELLEVRELTIEEWREWKTNQRRDPICMLWENDTSPMWVLSPNDIHEPAFLMGKLKLFNGKPTFEQCKEVKWD